MGVLGAEGFPSFELRKKRTEFLAEKSQIYEAMQ